MDSMQGDNAASGDRRPLRENLARCRNRADLSQEELGVRASLHRTEIGLLERGMRVARIDTLIKLAGALGDPARRAARGHRLDPGDTDAIGQFRLARARGGAG